MMWRVLPGSSKERPGAWEFRLLIKGKFNMTHRGKKYKENAQKVERRNRYGFQEAVQLALDCNYAKFDESVDVAVRLGVDPRHADQMVRGTVVLPNGVGKKVRVAVFAKGEKEKEALEAGADFAGSDELVEKVQGGWLEFDKAIATPDMMSSVGKLGRILGPRGMMPNAKLGTVTFDVAKAVQEIKAGKIDFKVEKAGIVHAPMGKVSFGMEKLVDNIAAFMETILRLKPPTSKGTYIRSIAISTTMGPGVKVDPTHVKDLLSPQK
jgi:large subunit ribosomal protein L1